MSDLKLKNMGKKLDENKKTQVYNLVILDRSGSMESIRRAAVEGFNETLSGIKKAQEKFGDTQEHFISLVSFCSCEIRKVFDKVPVKDAFPLKMEDYVPCCCTPLFDAMGFTLTSLRSHVKDIDDAVVVVTVITDGLENASKEYTGQSIKRLVEELRNEGWTFTYMGANQDAIEVAISLSIRNARNFDYSDEGVCESMKKDSDTRMNFFSHLAKFKESEDEMEEMTLERRRAYYTGMADNAFDEEESKQ